MWEFLVIGGIFLFLALLLACYLVRLKYLGQKEQGYKKVHYKKKKTCSNEVCPVCLEEFCVHDEVLLLFKCHHGFHKGCLEKWLKLKKSCPMCKSSVGEGEHTSLI